AEVQSRNSLSELTQMNRLAAAGELSASIAHEVSQPLAGMLTSAAAALRLVSRNSPDLGKAQDALRNVVAAGHRANDIVVSVRAMFGKNKHEWHLIDINKLIKTVLG